MYKKITSLLLTLLIIAASIQGFYLFKTIEQSKRQTITLLDAYKDRIESLKQVVGDYVQQVNRVDKQLRENEVKIEPTILTKDVVEKARKATVTLRTTSSIAAYENSSNWAGSGCIIDIDQGMIMTNAHVVGRATIGRYEVQFFNGTLAEAKLVYCDEWLDMALLQVEPKHIPHETIAPKFSKQEPTIGQPIFIVGNTANNSHSTHTGRVSSLESIVRSTGEYRSLPNGLIVYSLNRQGGSSGSGIFNHKGELIALHSSGYKTHGHGLNLSHYHKILKAVINKKNIPSKGIGILPILFPLSDVVKYSGISKESIEDYKKQLPKHTQHLIAVNNVLQGTPAEGILKPGDILFSINNQVIGGNLAKFDMIMRTTQQSSITLGILRNGNIMQVKVEVYDMNQHKIKRMVCFGGAFFFEADNTWSGNSNIPTGALTFHKIEKGRTFNTSKYFAYSEFYGEVTAFDNIPVANLDELIALIPKLVIKKHFSMNYTSPWKRKCVTLIDYNNLDPTPRIYTYNPETFRWDVEEIKL